MYIALLHCLLISLIALGGTENSCKQKSESFDKEIR